MNIHRMACLRVVKDRIRNRVEYPIAAYFMRPRIYCSESSRVSYCIWQIRDLSGHGRYYYGYEEHANGLPGAEFRTSLMDYIQRYAQ